MAKLSLRRPGLAIFALAAFALVALTAWRVQSLMAERAARLAQAQSTVVTAAVYVGNYIARTVDAAELLAREARVEIASAGGPRRVQPAAMQRRLAEMAARTSIEDNLLVVDAAGRPVAYSEGLPPAGASFADRAWFRAHSEDGAAEFLGPAVRSRVSGKVVYTYSETLTGPDGTFQGAVAVGIVPTPPKPLKTRRLGEPEAQLWTHDGRLIVSSHMDFDAAGNPAPRTPPFATPPKGPMGFLPTGADRMTAFRTAEGRPLVATVTLLRAELLAPWRADARDSVILLIALGLVLGALATIGARFADQDHRARVALEETAGALSTALAEKEVLLREIHHRVKNNLQITSSLMHLQARNFDDPQVRLAFDQTQQRLRSISLVHDVLYHENTSARVNLAVYLGELTQEIANAHGADARGVTVRHEVAPIELGPGQVTPVGLCVAEALTNAFKHAFPEGRVGSVLVSGRVEGEEVRVVVRDDGPGFDESARRKGSLGLMLISVLARQLKGRASFTNDGGTVFELSFPEKP